jgi:hypothetical protein
VLNLKLYLNQPFEKALYSPTPSPVCWIKADPIVPGEVKFVAMLQMNFAEMSSVGVGGCLDLNSRGSIRFTKKQFLLVSVVVKNHFFLLSI